MAWERRATNFSSRPLQRKPIAQVVHAFSPFLSGCGGDIAPILFPPPETLRMSPPPPARGGGRQGRLVSRRQARERMHFSSWGWVRFRLLQVFFAYVGEFLSRQQLSATEAFDACFFDHTPRSTILSFLSHLPRRLFLEILRLQEGGGFERT